MLTTPVRQLWGGRFRFIRPPLKAALVGFVISLGKRRRIDVSPVEMVPASRSGGITSRVSSSAAQDAIGRARPSAALLTTF